MMARRGPRLRRLALSGLLLAGSACAASAATAAEAVPVGGRVLGPAGRGVAGAAVELLPEPRRATPGPAAEPVARAVTGPDGGFQLAAPGPGLFRVRVAAAGSPAMEHPLHPLLYETRLAPLILGPLSEGRDAARSGWRPAADVAVRLAVVHEAAPSLEAHTRPDGGFLLGGVPTARSLELRATLTGVESRPGDAGGRRLAALRGLAPLRPRQAHGGLRLVLSPWPAVTGRVVDGAGRPLDGARLRLLAEPAGGAPAARTPSPAAEAHSRTDGRFELVDAGPGPFRLEVERAGFVPLVIAGVAGVAGLVARAGRDLADVELGDLRLEAGVTLAGRVLDEGEEPVAGAAIEAHPAAGGEPRRAASGEDGAFALADLPPGERLAVTVRHPDFATARLPEVEVSPAPLDIVLRAGATVSGRVVDGAGRGVGEAVLLVAPDGDPPRGESPGAEADADTAEQQAVEPDGRFTVRGLPAGRVTLRATAPGYREARLVGIEVAPDAPLEGVELALEQAAVLIGSVRAADGAPLPGARVSLVRGEADDAPFAAAVADDAGAFRIEGLEPGPVRAEAEHPGHRRAARPLDLTLGENRVDLVLGQGLAVAGRVVDDAGAPVGGAEVAVEAAPGALGSRSTRSGADGSFRLAGLEPGPLALTARGDGFVPARLELELGAEPVEGLEVRLARGGAVAGRLLGLAAADLERVEVAAFAPDRGTRAGVVEPGGLYRIEGLSSGDWTVAAGAGARQARGRVRIDGGEAELDLDFGSGLRLAGRVRVGGRPLAGAEVTLAGTAGQGLAATSTGAAGEFELTGLAAGPYRLRVAEPRGGFSHEQTVELDADRELALDLAAERVAGQVEAADGSGPVPGAVVRLEPLAGSAGAVAATLTDSTGYFLLSLVPEGEASTG